ncbi:hypothetical protein DFA_04303 [Cavenderia fasciculata]|uniref:DUF221 family protein n=1 Tax=Cavenderia fasciculata TaxID=261658 RepID=F4PP72_CACFS|nr:uncharacterized protein DFA_04303 [Cavenderia fasciculata]EGG22185.1 hypothetical protein DFA_04303 [Cavenderia fasciculata]|eukprot:XP_004360036.1 hypothetical protein DFA_04303 [Cavenderia fasciculata]
MTNRYEVQDSAFVVTLVINVVIGVLGLILFCVLRRRYNLVYRYRYEMHQQQGTTVDQPPSNTFFGWIGSTIRYPNQKIIEHSGLDAYFYLRQIKTSLMIMVILMVLSAIALYPTNYYGKYNENRPTNEDGELVDEIKGLSLISMSNIERGSNKLWVHLCFTLIVTAVVLFFTFLDYREYSIKRILYKCQNRLCNYSVLIKDIPESISTKDQLTNFLYSFFPPTLGDIQDVVMHHPADHIFTLIQQREGFIKSYEVAQEKSKKKVQFVKTGFLGCFGEKREALEYYQQRINELNKEIESERHEAENNRSTAAFVVFSQKQSAKISVQTIMNRDYPYQFRRHDSPDPSDIFWKNLSVGYKSILIRTLLVSIFIFFLVFFWSIPVAFLSGFSNLATLAKISAFSWLVDIINKSSVLSGFLQGFLPNLVLIIFMIILVPIITLASKIEGFHSFTSIDKSVFSKYFFFQVFNVFLISAIAGSIFQSLESIVNNPSTIITLLSTALPGQAFQMINLIMIASVGVFLQVLRLIELIVKSIRIRYFVSTKRQLEEVQKCGPFSYSTSYTTNLLYLQICLAYSTLTPFILIFGTIYFMGAYLAQKYNIIWVNTPNYQSGGSLYPLAYRRSIVGLIIYQLVMIGVFNVYDFFWGNLVIIPLVATLLFWAHCEFLFCHKSEHGILDSRIAQDEDFPLNNQGIFYDAGLAYQSYNETQYQPPWYRPLMAVQNSSLTTSFDPVHGAAP